MRKLTTQEFIDRARAVHGDKYSYDSVNYTSNKNKVSILCPDHGLFSMTPNSHLLGQNCPKCSGKHRLTEQEFIAQARVIHRSDEYDYSAVNYVNKSIKVSIVCREHGVFKQTPKSHLLGRGCITCAGVKKHTNESFATKANLVHNNKYDYSSINYFGAHIKISIMCPEHGMFEQTPGNHLSGVGCPSCMACGFDRTKPASLYILRSDCGSYMKIGITHKPDQRHAQLSRETPFHFECIELIEGPGDQIANLEKELLAEYRPVEFTKTFDGYSEWRLWDDSIRHKLISFMDKELTNGPV